MFRTPSKSYWNDNWGGAQPRGSLSSLNVYNRDLKALFASLGLGPTAQVAEIGFAPGKALAWIHDHITRNVVGVDYSEIGCAAGREFFRAHGRNVRILCEDATAITDLQGQMDLVYSNGVIEHFADPSDMLGAHLRWLNDGGTAFLLIPNYSGLYRNLQARLDPGNLEIHNLESMSPEFWTKLGQRFPGFVLSANFYGHPSPWLLSLQKYGPAGRLLQYALNFLAFLWPRHTRYAAAILITGRRVGASR